LQMAISAAQAKLKTMARILRVEELHFVVKEFISGGLV
jgi:hypothetical protein